ncbi:MAG: pyrroloquinoline-quinone synthase PqqC [Thaumarchaeota archaeon]|nr:pyrroloquinoline-quinone synthase PqqC [Nitrososphaerota archaeon]
MKKDTATNSFVQSLLKEGEKRFPSAHPFMKLFYSGRLSKEQMRGWAINRYYFHRNIPPKEAAIVSNCPDHVRKFWAEKLLEEDGGEGKPSHPDLWIRFCEDLGLKRKEVENAKMLPAVKMAVDGYVNLARYRPWRVGVGASLTEYSVPKRMEKIIAAFKQHYPYVTENGMGFFREHMIADKEHGQLTIDLIEQNCKTAQDRREVKEGYFYKIDLHRVILDAVYLKYVIGNQN